MRKRKDGTGSEGKGREGKGRDETRRDEKTKYSPSDIQDGKDQRVIVIE
jgi:hypothetical protein